MTTISTIGSTTPEQELREYREALAVVAGKYAQLRAAQLRAELVGEQKTPPSTSGGEPPAVGSHWVHGETGHPYTVIMIANILANNPSFPTTVIYTDKFGYTWARPLSEWFEKMRPFDQRTIRIPVHVIMQWRDTYLDVNDPGDGTDCVTPFDQFLYGGVK